MSDLKACPFCNGIAKFYSITSISHYVYIQCDSCKSMARKDFIPNTNIENYFESYSTAKQDVITLWNTRV